MKSASCLCVLACGVVFLSGCRTTKDVLNDYEKNISVGQYTELPEEVKTLAEKEDGSQLLWRLMTGSAYYLTDDRPAAIAQFDKAEDTLIANGQTSVFTQGTRGALAMMTNDRAFPYDGGGQDRVFTCLYKAIDYMAQNRTTAARTELNRASQHQENWLWERRRDIDAAAKKLEEDAAGMEKQKGVTNGDRSKQVNGVLADASFGAQIKEKCSFDPASSGNLETLSTKDYMNTYVQHVCGVFRWLNGDGGRQYLRDVSDLRPGNTVLAQDAREITSGVRPSDQVWIYAEDGLCPCREEWRIDLPIVLLPFAGRYVLYAGMALPYLRYRTFGAASWSVASGTGTSTAMSELADIDRLMKTEYDVYMRGALTREITRTIVKISAQVALGIAADNTGDWRHQTALRVSQVGVATWAATTTAADLRCWAALPKKVYMARITRPASGTFEVIADNQRIRIAVPKGNSMVFLRKAAPSAYPVVKQVNFR